MRCSKVMRSETMVEVARTGLVLSKSSPGVL
jgi:hypothetical protein